MSWKSWPTIKSLTAFRTAKYKQRRVLCETGWIEDAHLKVGACTGLSLEWLKAHHAKPGGSASSRMDSFKVGGRFAYIAQLAKVFNSVGLTYEERIQLAARAYLGRADLGKMIAGAETAQLLTYLAANPGYGMLLMELSPAKTNHVCAYFQDATGLTFFDPNSGEYRAKDGDRTALIAALRAQYLTYLPLKGPPAAPQTIKNWVLAKVTPL